jgi:RNA recognition motif-containing protein
MAKKTAAQIRRLEQRAAKRGEEYHYTPPEPESDASEEENENDKDVPQDEKGETTATTNEEEDPQTTKRLEVARKLTEELQEIEENLEVKSKDRRSAKRKAEVIATEDAGMPASELLEWYEANKTTTTTNSSNDKNSVDNPNAPKLKAAAVKLQKELETIEGNEEMKAKDRRSAKRKAEAIASEEAGMSVLELSEWYEKYQKSKPKSKQQQKQENRNKHDPYITFIGQLSYDTTREQLFEHIVTQLKDDHKVLPKDVKIRILSDPKTKKSKGTAFVEVEDPELLYGLLKLHKTHLNGRRINVERSAGGKKNSEARKTKLAQYKKEQDEYFGEVVDSILSEYRKTGELREDELDGGVVALCKRHAGPIVRAAVAKYIEGGGRDMDNPSAYLTFLLTKFAEEGIYEEDENSKPHKPRDAHKSAHKDKRKGPAPSKEESAVKRLKQSSGFAQSGVDMSSSTVGSKGDLSKIFPSAKRGRGRGYM